MATKAEQVRAENEKKGVNPKRAKKAAQKKPAKTNDVAKESKATGKKATVAKETTAPGKRPSRKSTRSSANRAKPDTNLILRQERAKRAPTATARSEKAKASRARGKSGRGGA